MLGVKTSEREPEGMGMREIALRDCGLRSRPMWVGVFVGAGLARAADVERER